VPVPKGPLLFQARFDGSAGDIVIEKSGTASTQVVNGELRVTIGGSALDAVKVSLPQRPSVYRPCHDPNRAIERARLRTERAGAGP